MASIYQELQGVASELLAEFDQGGIYYIAVVPGTGPAQNPGPSVETPFKIDGAARGVSFKYIDNKNVVATDLQVTMAVNPNFTPNEKGFVLIGSARYKVIAIIRKPAAGTPVAWTVIIRK